MLNLDFCLKDGQGVSTWFGKAKQKCNVKGALSGICKSAKVVMHGLLVFLIWIPAFATTVITSNTVLNSDLNDNVVIGADDIVLDCNGHSIIGRPPSMGIAMTSRSGITIQNCRVTGFLTGIQAGGGSSVTVADTTVERNLLNGLEANDNSSLSIIGAFTALDNGVFGLLFSNSASGTMTGATVLLQSNAGGLQVGVSSSLLVTAVPPLPPTRIVAEDNTAFGLTAVSNSHIFLFGPIEILTRRNGSNGISVFTKSGVELDNGASIIAEDNAENGIRLEDATLNMFNMPQFTGSSISLKRNGESGLNVAKASVFDMGDDATMINQGNPVGLRVDDGSSVRVRASKIILNDRDVVMTFGARGDFEGNTIGNLRCDRTVLIRGDRRCHRRR